VEVLLHLLWSNSLFGFDSSKSLPTFATVKTLPPITPPFGSSDTPMTQYWGFWVSRLLGPLSLTPFGGSDPSQQPT